MAVAHQHRSTERFAGSARENPPYTIQPSGLLNIKKPQRKNISLLQERTHTYSKYYYLECIHFDQSKSFLSCTPREQPHRASQTKSGCSRHPSHCNAPLRGRLDPYLWTPLDTNKTTIRVWAANNILEESI